MNIYKVGNGLNREFTRKEEEKLVECFGNHAGNMYDARFEIKMLGSSKKRKEKLVLREIKNKEFHGEFYNLDNKLLDVVRNSLENMKEQIAEEIGRRKFLIGEKTKVIPVPEVIINKNETGLRAFIFLYPGDSNNQEGSEEEDPFLDEDEDEGEHLVKFNHVYLDFVPQKQIDHWHIEKDGTRNYWYTKNEIMARTILNRNSRVIFTILAHKVMPKDLTRMLKSFIY